MPDQIESVVDELFFIIVVVVDPRNLPLKFGQNKVIYRRDLVNIDGHPQTQGWSPTRRKCSTDMEFG